ncbi:hypothetical protein Srufu_078790 [Streptomyces libani subsp. rufus]|nr:hypothetical protein Srufu_078790 [Streptomyces libani subsp. rufus]
MQEGLPVRQLTQMLSWECWRARVPARVSGWPWPGRNGDLAPEVAGTYARTLNGRFRPTAVDHERKS